MNRRDFITRSSAAVLAASISAKLTSATAAESPAPAAKSTPETYPFAVAPLAFAYNALEPHIDEATMKLHHDKHHVTYVTNLNLALKDHPELQTLTIEQLLAKLGELPPAIQTAVRNQGGGHINHRFFWNILRPPGVEGAGAEPSGPLASAIIAEWGSVEKMKTAFNEAATKVFGSGWAFLNADAKTLKLSIATKPNQDSDLARADSIGLLGCDVWEHAYYLHYQNRRADYLKAFWNVVAWDVAAKNYAAAKTAL
jgi:superoxide dismutase, Fe-Mn family